MRKLGEVPKAPWEDPRTPWSTESQFMAYLRGCFRKAWNTHPVKLAVIKNNRKKVENPNPKGLRKEVWGFCCDICNQESVIKNAQVDHKEACGSLQRVEDIQGFVERLLVVVEEDLRLICKHCNSILAYADKHSLTFEQARIEKEVIAFSKLTKEEQLATLLDQGFSGDEVSNLAKRKDAYRKYLLRR